VSFHPRQLRAVIRQPRKPFSAGSCSCLLLDQDEDDAENKNSTRMRQTHTGAKSEASFRMVPELTSNALIKLDPSS
jgi:hypothetical protein